MFPLSNETFFSSWHTQRLDAGDKSWNYCPKLLPIAKLLSSMATRYTCSGMHFVHMHSTDLAAITSFWSESQMALSLGCQFWNMTSREIIAPDSTLNTPHYHHHQPHLSSKIRKIHDFSHLNVCFGFFVLFTIVAGFYGSTGLARLYLFWFRPRAE